MFSLNVCFHDVYIHFSIRIGRFLRSSPTARLLLLGYIALLHAWFFFLTSTAVGDDGLSAQLDGVVGANATQ